MFHHTNRPSYRYKKPEAQNGDLRTPLTFYTSKVEEGLHGRDVSHEKAFYTMGQVYSPSFKDIEIVSEPLDIKSSLKEEDLPLIEKMADDIKASIEAAEIKDVF